MNAVAKNLVLMGASVVFIALFYGYSEINRSQLLIDFAEDPQKSVVRGFDDADKEYEEGIASFRSYKGRYLGVSDAEIKASSERQPSFIRFYCGFGRLKDSIALNIRDYEYNHHYVLAYNTRLKTLTNKDS